MAPEQVQYFVRPAMTKTTCVFAMTSHPQRAQHNATVEVDIGVQAALHKVGVMRRYTLQFHRYVQQRIVPAGQLN
jgi:hypothetical protein